MTRKELLQIPGLGALMESLDGLPASPRALQSPPQGPAHLASPGEVWRVKELDPPTQEPDYSPTNPHCSTVLILKHEEELGGNGPKDLAVFRVAPVLADLRYCGVEDAIFPREVFGYEAAVACGCEFTLTSKELERCEGVLPDVWFDQLADFAAWMEAEESEAAPAFPPLLKTGRPFTHTDDPGYIFHANLATNLQPLMATVLETILEPRPVRPSLWERLANSIRARTPQSEGEALVPLAAAAGTAPDSVRRSHLDNRVGSVLHRVDQNTSALLIVSDDAVLCRLRYSFEGQPELSGSVELHLSRGSYWAEVVLPHSFAELHERPLSIEIEAAP